jgi:hypothetical protein
MMKSMRLSRGLVGRRLGVAATIVAAAFILASAALPFAHHSVECQLTSLTHCAACTVGASAKLAHDHAELVPLPRHDAGAALAPAPVTPESPSLCQTSDRAPPLAG